MPRLLKQLGWWLLIVAAMLIGIIAGAAALLGVAALAGSRTLGAISGALALVVCTGGLSWLAARGMARDPRTQSRLAMVVTSVTLVAVVPIVGLVIFAPAPRATPFAATSDTQYWDLPTGSRIAYVLTPAQGVQRPTPAILVHGGPGSPDRENTSLARALAEAGFDVYDYHQVGAGLSGRLADASEYTVARHVADLDAIRVTLDADRVVLVGASWGGKLIANYLAAYPDHVARAVVASPAPFWSPAFMDTEGLTESGRQDQQAVIENFPRFMLAHLLLRAVGPEAAQGLLPDSTMDGIFEAIVAQLDLWSGCSGRSAPPPAPIEDGPAGFGFWVNAVTSLDAEGIADPRPALRTVPTPVLVLRGECDYIAWEVTREYRDLLPNAVMLAIDDAGHVIPTDQPDLFQRAVLAFLQDDPLPQEAYTGDAAPW